MSWTAGNPAPTTAYRVYYDQSGKRTLRGSVAASATSYKDGNLSRTQYCYVVTAFGDCNGNGAVDAGEEGAASTPAACAIAQ